jgi:hypothetical protein
VTNLEADSRAVVRFYNKRGTAEQWIKEGKQAVKMTRLSCHRFRSNEVRLWLSVIAYNLGNLWRRFALPERIRNWSLTSLQQRLVKTGGTAGETCALLLVAIGRRAPESEAVRQHAENDRGAAPAGRVVNRERHRMERLEVLQRGQVLAVRLGWTRQTDQPRSMERPKRAVMPPKRGHDDLSMNQ